MTNINSEFLYKLVSDYRNKLQLLQAQYDMLYSSFLKSNSGDSIVISVKNNNGNVSLNNNLQTVYDNMIEELSKNKTITIKNTINGNYQITTIENT